MICCFQVLQILCSSNGIFPNIRRSAEESSEIEEVLEEDFDVDGEMNMEETSCFHECTTDVRTHLALAMLGVDDNLISRTSSLDHSGLELLHLDGRFRLSSSFVQ